MLGAALSDLRRLRRIAGVLTRHGFQEIATRLWSRGSPDPTPLTELASAELVEGAKERRRLPPEQRFCQVLEELGPTFIKLGQVLSTRHDLLPLAYIEALSRLQDHVDPLPFEQIAGELEAGLGRPATEVFASIDPRPLATASIAQVHAGTLLDGTPVVLKVQRPGTGGTIEADLDVLRALARLVEATIEEARGYDPVGIVAQFEEALSQELDYLHEARNLEDFRKNFEQVDYIVVPRCYGQASSRTVLTLERIEGIRLRDLPADAPGRALLTERMIAAAYQMLFVDGLFHADPHPGNIFILPEERIGLIDFGLVGRVSGQMRETLVQLGLGISSRDVAGLARLFYRLGSGGQRIDLHQFRREIQDLLDRYLGVALGAIDTSSLIGDLFELAVRYRIRVPPSYALLIKASATIEGVVRALSPDLDVIKATRPYAQRMLAERYGPQELGMRALRVGFELGGMLQDLPLEIEQVMMDLESGRLRVQVESEAVRELGDRLNALGTRIFLGLIAAGTIVGTALVLVRFPLEVLGPRATETAAWTFGALVLLGVAVVSGLVVTATTWHLLSARFPKVKLRGFVRLSRWLFGSREPQPPVAPATLLGQPPATGHDGDAPGGRAR